MTLLYTLNVMDKPEDSVPLQGEGNLLMLGCIFRRHALLCFSFWLDSSCDRLPKADNIDETQSNVNILRERDAGKASPDNEGGSFCSSSCHLHSPVIELCPDRIVSRQKKRSIAI